MKSNIERSSHRRCSVKHLCFPTKFAKFLGTPILKNICERLLLYRGLGCDVDDLEEDKDKRIGYIIKYK